MGYEAYVLDKKAREELKALFPPKYPEWVGHHATHKFGVTKSDHPMAGYGCPVTIKVFGYVIEDGLEAFVCTVNDKSHRPDGRAYHVTWSLDRSKGKKPVDSNLLIEKVALLPFSPVFVKATFEYVS